MPGLQKKLVENGLKRKDDFSWEKTAKETLEIYEHFNKKG